MSGAEAEGGGERTALIRRILEKQKVALPDYQQARSNPVPLSNGTFDRATLWNDSPPGVEIRSHEFGEPTFNF